MSCPAKDYYAFSNGAMNGHAEGKGRSDQYLIGEEILLSWDASEVLPFKDVHQRASWVRGFQYGYQLAAEGSELEPGLAE